MIFETSNEAPRSNSTNSVNVGLAGIIQNVVKFPSMHRLGLFIVENGNESIAVVVFCFAIICRPDVVTTSSSPKNNARLVEEKILMNRV